MKSYKILEIRVFIACLQGMGKHLEESIPGSKLSLVPGQGHFAYFDESVFQEVIAWLKGKF